jgi:hypothetical protein
MSGAAPVFDGDEDCSPFLTTSDSDGCQRFAACGPSMALGDGVDMAQLKTRYAGCVPSTSGGSDCSCSDDDSSFSFHLSTPPDDASCEASIPNCDPHAVFESTGPTSWEPESL